MIKDIHDINPPIEISFNYFPIVLFFVILIGILLLLLYFSLRKKSNKPEPVFQEKRSKLSAKESALLKIQELKKQGFIEENRYEIFYTKLSDILKTYLSERYNIEFESKTSYEILNQLKSIQLSYDFMKQLELSLKDLDYIKYSNFMANSFEMENSIDLIMALLKTET